MRSEDEILKAMVVLQRSFDTTPQFTSAWFGAAAALGALHWVMKTGEEPEKAFAEEILREEPVNEQGVVPEGNG